MDGDRGPHQVMFLVDGREVTVVDFAARFETPVDVTVAEQRIELLFPADPQSTAFFG